MNKQTIKTLFTISFSLFFFFIWWKIYGESRIGFRGVGFQGTASDFHGRLDHYLKMCSYCGDLPACLRTLHAWVVLFVEMVVTRPLFKIFRPDLVSNYSSIVISDTVVTSSAYVLTNALLLLQLPLLVGIPALVGYGITPLMIPCVGVTSTDSFVLLFWSCVIAFSSSKLASMACPENEAIRENEIGLLMPAVVGAIGSFVMENTGIAFCAAIGVLFVTRKLHGYRISFSSLISASVASGGVLAFGWVMTHRHPDVSVVEAGGTLATTWDYYGKFNSFASLKGYLRQVSYYPRVFSCSALFLLLISRPWIENPYTEKMKAVFWISLCCSAGFLTTTLVGRYVSGLGSEWPRQLLPFSLLSSWTGASGAVLLSDYFYRYWRRSP